MNTDQFATFKPYVGEPQQSDNIELTSDLVATPENISKYYRDNNLQPENLYFMKYMEEGLKPNTVINTPLEQGFKLNVTPITEQDAPLLLTSRSSGKVTSNNIINEINSMNVPEEKKNYLTVLAGRESSYDPYVTNKYGYYGLYQFGTEALKDTGYTKNDFQNTLNQHNAALKLADRNERVLAPIINSYVGKTYKGEKITKNGILAAAHLLGAGTVKKWFNPSNNEDSKTFQDANGTTINKYLQLFT